MANKTPPFRGREDGAINVGGYKVFTIRGRDLEMGHGRS